MLEKLVFDASADAVLLMLPPAAPFAVAELLVGRPTVGRADTFTSKTELEALRMLAELPMPRTSTLLLSVSGCDFSTNEPEITPLAAWRTVSFSLKVEVADVRIALDSLENEDS